MSFKADKNLRKNQGHVHNSHLFTAITADLKTTFMLVQVFAAPVAYDETVKKIEAGFYGEKRKALFASNSKTLVNIELTLFVCSSCGYYESDHNLGLYVLKDGLTEEEIELVGQDPNEEKARYTVFYTLSLHFRNRSTISSSPSIR